MPPAWGRGISVSKGRLLNSTWRTFHGWGRDPGNAGSRRPSSSWKQRAQKLAVLVTTLVLLALLLEGTIRLFTDTLPPLREHDALIGGRYLPSFEGHVFNSEVHRKVLLRFNADGFRGSDRALEKPPGTRRIALLGDSMVAALEVEERDTMVCLLEQTLNQARWGGAARS